MAQHHEAKAKKHQCGIAALPQKQVHEGVDGYEAKQCYSPKFKLRNEEQACTEGNGSSGRNCKCSGTLFSEVPRLQDVRNRKDAVGYKLSHRVNSHGEVDKAEQLSPRCFVNSKDNSEVSQGYQSKENADAENHERRV